MVLIARLAAKTVMGHERPNEQHVAGAAKNLLGSRFVNVYRLSCKVRAGNDFDGTVCISYFIEMNA